MTITQELADAWKTFKTWVETHVEPDVEKAETAVVDVVKVWVAQFETDFGKAALAAATAAIATFAAGGWPAVPALSAAAGELLLQQGLSIAEADAQTVILNAARTALNAVSTTQNPGATNG